MEVAWFDFVNWSVNQPDIVARFNKETGKRFLAPCAPIERMIDEATGKLDSDVKAFAVWVTETMWGMDYAPESLRSLESCG